MTTTENLLPLDDENIAHITYLSGMYENWFLDYASYVILERAVPALQDGLKPVQRRLLHSMDELEDGRYNKVANIIGNTMKYHPHGDASIGDALVALGQKDLLIDCQGNWGNIFTGDGAAAARYIEARLSPLAKDILFNPKTTTWKLSYDGRNKEPLTLPVKFPLLLAQGVEGIAVGMSCKILPHNFIELLDACIAILKNEAFQLYPDFRTGGQVDVTRYNDGQRGGKVRVRATIEAINKTTLVITDIPFGTNTTSIIESIIAANEKEKIKIKKVEDSTAEKVEIIVHLPAGISTEKAIDALYACTDCEVSISINACNIYDNKPNFTSVSAIIKENVELTQELLTQELEIEKKEVQQKLHLALLEKIFIQNKIYTSIEQCESYEEVLLTIEKDLQPYAHLLAQPISKEDVEHLTEIKIKRISKFDTNKAEENLANLQNRITEINTHLSTIVNYTIEYFKKLKTKYSKGKERKTILKTFDTIDVTQVVVNNEKLYVNRTEGFIGYGMKKDEYVCECSNIDEVIVIQEDGRMLITKIADKHYVGKDILHVHTFKRNDENTVYSVIYVDGETKRLWAKRFHVNGIIRDKEYNLTQGTPNSKIMYLSVTTTEETDKVNIYFKPRRKMKKGIESFDFASLKIKGRDVMGNLVTSFETRKVMHIDESPDSITIQLYYDANTHSINEDGIGKYIGIFGIKDKLITYWKTGQYLIMPFEDGGQQLSADIIHVEKFEENKIATTLYKDNNTVYVKRFRVDFFNVKTTFLPTEDTVTFMAIHTADNPIVQYSIVDGATKQIIVNDFMEIKNYRSKGKALTSQLLLSANFLSKETDTPVN